MNLFFLDFETYYSQEYSLKRMTPAEYILDARFDCLGCAVREGLDGTPYWLDGDQLPALFARLNATPNVAIITHNALFDLCIVAWKYGYYPRLSACTLSMARAMLGHKLPRLGLDYVAKYFNLAGKTGALAKVIGMHMPEIKAAGLYQSFVDYALHDVWLCSEIFRRLMSMGFPIEELAALNSVILCATKPRLKLDQSVLLQHQQEVAVKKQNLLTKAMALGADGKSDLMSNDKFAELLRGLGVEPPMKKSKTTGQDAYAFAKTDSAFIDLSNHPDPEVQALVSARLGHKSTLEESRTERLLAISNLTWPDGSKGWMPVPLKFSGAIQTHRLSGDWKINLQNLTRGGNLRRALTAPPGYAIVAVDASQIEARLVAWICGQLDLVEQFAKGQDVYSNFASLVFNMAVNKKDNPTERFVGKQGILGLGYGLGWRNFILRLKSDSKNQTGNMIILSDVDGQKVVNTYRSTYRKIPEGWGQLNDAGISALAGGPVFQFGPCYFDKERIHLPNKMHLHYEGLRWENSEWIFTSGVKVKRIYGGALLENICQALAKIIVMDAKIRIERALAAYGILMVMQVHDELIFVVPLELVETAKTIMVQEMSTPPNWGMNLPLAAEAGHGANYAEAK